MIDRATIDRIMDAANIVEVVSEFVTLRKAGVNYKGLCPFHDDKTPSFMVSPAKGICHCFACGKGGNSVNFIMEHEQLSYPDALRWLARKYHIEIKERELTDDERREQNERESMFIVNEWAATYFTDTLKTHPDGQAIGMQYFRSRGFRDDIIAKFRLGYALPQRDALSTAALKAGYREEYLVKTGLCYKRESDGQLVDRYAGRVIFPWLGVSGKVTAFGGRLLDSRTKGVQQKYVNSPESDIYHKDHELYGLFQAKRAIAKEDLVYMVEGYTDVLAMHQCGIENVVANSGTALSRHQIRLLHRFTSNIVLLYDGDAAGIHAAMRGTDMLLAEGMNIKVLVLPDGDDPDSFSRKHTAEEFRQHIADHQTDFIRFKTDQMLSGVTDPVKRSEAIGSIVRSVAVIPDPITRDTYLRECASRLEISEQTLVGSMNKVIRNNQEEEAKEAEREQRRRQRLEEEEALSPSQPSPVGRATVADMGLHTVEERLPEVETLLVKEMIRHGDEIIFDNLEDDEGRTVSLTVGQYIDFDLSQDDLHLSSPVYEQVRAEAALHSAEAGWKAEPYFINHPDVAINSLASRLSAERYQLSRSLAMEQKPETLRQRVTHLVLDFRMDIVKRQLRDIQQRMRQTKDMDTLRQLMQEYKDTQTLRDLLARQIGNDIIV